MRAHRKIGSKEAAMPTRRFKRIALAQLLLSGCAVMFGVSVLIEHAQAQPSVPTGPIPTPPTQSPTFNPSNPGTVPQPSYTPVTPSTPSTVPSGEVRSPVREEAPSTTARSERTPETRTVHRHHHHRGYYAGVGPTLGSFDCSTVGVFVFLLRMPITGQMAGIAIEARRIAVNIAKLPELSA
jgi:hypothetical protein